MTKENVLTKGTEYLEYEEDVQYSDVPDLKEAEAFESEVENEDISDCAAATLYYGSHNKAFTAEEEKEAFTRYVNDPSEKDNIVLHNMRLVSKIAHYFTRYCKCLDYEDLFMEGCIGLDTAIKRFDVTKGYKFSTYATWWIRQSIARAIYDQDSLIRIPVYEHEKIIKYSKMTEEEKKEYNKATNIENVIYLTQHLSLNQPVDDDDSDGTESIDFVSDDALEVEDKISQMELTGEMAKAVEAFARFQEKRSHKQSPYERTREIIFRRYGINGYEKETLEQLGQRFNITRERIRQICTYFFQYMEKEYVSRNFKDYMRRTHR